MQPSVRCDAPSKGISKTRTVEKVHITAISSINTFLLFVFIMQARITAEIEKNNRLLLDRLGQALETKNIDNTNKFYAQKLVLLHQRHSALSGKAQIELAKSMCDNKSLLKRIENVEPNYKFHEYEADELMHLQYLRTTSEFPQAYDKMPTKQEIRQHLVRSANVLESRCQGSVDTTLRGSSSEIFASLQGSNTGSRIRSHSSSRSRADSSVDENSRNGRSFSSTRPNSSFCGTGIADV